MVNFLEDFHTQHVMVMQWSGNTFHISGILWGDITSHQWVTKGHLCRTLFSLLIVWIISWRNSWIDKYFTHWGQNFVFFVDSLNNLLKKQLISYIKAETKWPPFSGQYFQMHFLWISFKISLRFVPDGPINNILVLIQTVAWCGSGKKPLSESMMA